MSIDDRAVYDEALDILESVTGALLKNVSLPAAKRMVTGITPWKVSKNPLNVMYG